jgi:hypothetical protein
MRKTNQAQREIYQAGEQVNEYGRDKFKLDF